MTTREPDRFRDAHRKLASFPVASSNERSLARSLISSSCSSLNRYILGMPALSRFIIIASQIVVIIIILNNNHDDKRTSIHSTPVTADTTYTLCCQICPSLSLSLSPENWSHTTPTFSAEFMRLPVRRQQRRASAIVGVAQTGARERGVHFANPLTGS